MQSKKNDVIYPLYDSDLWRPIRYVPGPLRGVDGFMEDYDIHYLYAPQATALNLVKWAYPYGGHQIGVRNGKMATWFNVKSENREYDSGILQAGEWTHLAFTFNGNQAISYVNGEIVAELGHKGLIEFSRKPHFVIVERSTVASGEPFGGAVDEVALFNRLLTQKEIRDIMGQGVSSIEVSTQNLRSVRNNTQGLVAYYRFDADSSDFSCNGHDGNLVGDAMLLMDDGAPIPGGSGCIRFTGLAGNRVDCGESMGFRIASNLTLMAWVKPDSTDGTQFVAETPYAGLERRTNMVIEDLIRRDEFSQVVGCLYAPKSNAVDPGARNSGD